ncbi:leucine-rich repeat domain-containing protein [Xanthomarina gelatinilytica]|uniref:leucine-rich repeat domain-containing protein n=1 Tax=Xanthomarina gelatinilytica TaxID=1137281 RepID=UPI003AA91EED
MKRLLLFTLVLFGVYVNAQEISQSDKDALIALYNATDGANWTNKWDLNDSPQNWYGVKTNVVFGASGAERHVDEINLPNNNLVGTLPTELGSLKSLNVLNLSNNSISGAIPGGLGYAKDLNYLYLQNNQLSGEIPVELFTLTERHFVEINLSSNLLTGKLPVEIGNAIANVGDVYVSNNFLTDLPDYTASTLFRIKTLDVSNNNIPFAVFERIPSLDNIAKVLEDNVATLTYSPQNKINEEENIVFEEGTNVSFSVTGLSSTNNTYQWFNNSASITGATSATYQITSASLADAGTYYCEIQNSSVPNLILKRNNIVYRTVESINDKNALIAFYNATDGANWTDPWDLNADISTWKGVTTNVNGRVTELNHEQRKLNGTLPDDIGNLTELTKLTLIGVDPTRNLTGSIPSTICNLTKLENIKISQLDLNGVIPSCLFTITTLKSVNIQGQAYDSRLTLDLPNDLSSLTNLTQLILIDVDLSSNSGVPLSSLTNLTELGLINVDLSFEEGFPMSLLKLSNLKDLRLDGNAINGSIPPAISNLTKLEDLYITDNNITGTIPEEIGLLSNLRSLMFSGIPLTGTIPSTIGNLTNLYHLNIFRTNIEGEIPSSFSKLTSLRYLYIYGNKQLTGQIPSSINTISTLETLELGNNNFVGTLPDFTGLTNLFKLNISSNNFVFQDFESEYTSYKTSMSSNFVYQPQSNIDTKKTIKLLEGEVLTLTTEATNSSNNTYQWRKDGVNITGATDRTYVINSVAISDIGIYDCVIKNSIVTDLTLTKNEIELKVTSKDAIHDKNALIALYNATDGPNWTNSWDLSADMSSWEGVTLNQVGRVAKISLEGNNLKGNIPIEIGSLTELSSLILYGNQLTGNIPTEIGNLTNLSSLILSGNQLTGNIPPEIGNLTNLKELNLANNQLNGSIPTEIGNLTNLKELNLANNQLNGNIPTEIGNLTNLTLLLELSRNQLTGSIPTEIGNLTSLKFLELSRNQLTGSIPTEIGNMANLKLLGLSRNQLTGSIPSEVGNLANLTSLDLSVNQLTGSIPSEVGNLINLVSLYLSKNQLTGSVPSEVGNLTNLTWLYLFQNQLTGSIPLEIGNLTNLIRLDLSNNQLIGSIPSGIGSLIKLSSLYLSDNQLTGGVPSAVGNLTKLSHLNLSYNDLSGEIPASFGTLLELNEVNFSHNSLSGSLPANISTKINNYNISYNKFIFDDIEPVVDFYNGKLTYYNQAKLDTEISISINEREEITFSVVQTTSTNNSYQWRKNGVEIVGANEAIYTISNTRIEDSGKYDCIITNSKLPNLTLLRNGIEVTINMLDEDKDGVSDFTDKCLGTLEGESVNADGCSESQLDDDNDGVNNDKDLCLNTPAGESVNSNGCSESQLDDDNDGINNDKDLCPNTPTGESVNAGGCSESQLDDDNDGVFNNVDQCPNTSEGSVVDANGCAQYQLIDIAPSDIQVMVSSTTCPDKSNGIVNLSFKKNYTYKVILVGQGVINKTFDNVNYTSGLEITGLPVGIYAICVTASELPSFSQCYDVKVSAPAALKVLQTSLKGASLTYQVSGSENYKVTINDKEYLYTFKDAGKQEITVSLDNGNNSVEITTNKPCQGVYNKSVIANGITLYPIPVTNYLNISGITDNTAMVTVRSLEGAAVLSAKLDVYNGVVKLSMDTIATGMYLVTVTTSTQTVNTKIFKK